MLDTAIFSVDFDNEVVTIGRVYNTIRLIVEPKEENTVAFGLVLTPNIIAKMMTEIKYVSNTHCKGQSIVWETDENDNHYSNSISFEPNKKDGVLIHLETEHNGIHNTRTLKGATAKVAELHNKLMAFRAE